MGNVIDLPPPLDADIAARAQRIADEPGLDPNALVGSVLLEYQLRLRVAASAYMYLRSRQKVPPSQSDAELRDLFRTCAQSEDSR